MKKFVTIALSVLMALSCTFVAACTKGGEPSSEVPPTPSAPSTPSTPTEPSTPDDKGKEDDGGKEEPTPPIKTKAEAVAAFNAAVQSIQADKNFTYTELGAEYVAEFDGTKLKVTEGGDSVFYATEAEKNYCYALRDSVWHKDFSETTVGEVFTALTAVYGDAVWSEYDAEANQLFGAASGGTIRATVLDGTVTVEVAQKKFTLTKLGTTAVSLPADAIDDTDPSNFIFTTDASGETVWNVKLIAETIKNWWPEGYYKKLQFNDCDLVDILAVEYKENRLTFLGYFSGDTFKCLQEMVMPKKYFVAWLNSGDLKTAKDLVKYLNSIEYSIDLGGAPIIIEYSTLDQDYATAHKQEFETLTKNVFEKYHKEKAANDPNYNGAKIYFAFKTAAGQTNLGSDGYGKEWSQYYLVKNSQKLELIEIRMRGLVTGLGYYENVLQNVEGKWSLENYGKVVQIAEISPENLALFDEPLMTIGSIA